VLAGLVELEGGRLRNAELGHQHRARVPGIAVAEDLDARRVLGRGRGEMDVEDGDRGAGAKPVDAFASGLEVTYR
jgi:hypothetical protein